MRRQYKQIIGLIFLTSLWGAACNMGGDTGTSPGTITTETGFEQYVIDGDPDKPSFIHTSDIDNDGKLELIVSVFAGSGPTGSGYVNIYSLASGNDLSNWTKEQLAGSNGTKFPNSASTHDIDDDGDLDIIVPSGFLAASNSGAMTWYEQTGASWAKHEIVKGKSLFYHHAEYVDLNDDGYMDLVTVGETKGIFNSGRAETHVFYGNDSALAFETSFTKISDGLGSIPSVLDLDGDNDLDIVSAEYFGSNGSFAWLESQGGNWAKHYIDNESGKSIQFSFIDNLYGDGKVYAVGANHTNTKDSSSDPESAVFVYDIPSNLTQPWPRTKISEGIQSDKSPFMAPQGAPGVFHWGDIDGDGDIDIIVHGDGDPNVYWLEQLSPGNFATKVIVTDFNQGGVAVADLDGDGIDEVVASSYQNNKLHIYKFITSTNSAPVADFAFTADKLYVEFADDSTDTDGSIVDWSWNFGDDTTSNQQNPSHTYSSEGTYNVTLTVTDDDGATGSISKQVQVVAGSTNNPPEAEFTFTTSDLTANFTDASTDDGSIVSWDWDFGDSTFSSEQNPSHTYASEGSYSVSLTVTDDGGQTDTQTKVITVEEPVAQEGLKNGEAVTVAGNKGEWGHHYVNLPEGASNLSMQISGGSGDADLYTRFGEQPTSSSYDCRPYEGGNNEECKVADPQTGKYYVSIHAYQTYSNVSLVASFEVAGTQFELTVNTTGEGSVSLNPAGGKYAQGTVVTVTANPASGWEFENFSGDLSGSTNPATVTMNSDKSVTATFSKKTIEDNELQNGKTIYLSAANGTWNIFYIEVPEGASNLSMEILGGSGDADLYTLFGAQPTSSNYNCRPYKNGNNEKCAVASPKAGKYYVGLYAYKEYENIALVASFE